MKLSSSLYLFALFFALGNGLECNRDLVLCRLPKDVKLKQNIIFKKTKYTHWNGFLNDTLKNMNITIDSNECNLKINYQTKKPTPFTLTEMKYHFYLTETINEARSKMPDCGGGTLIVDIPTKIPQKTRATTTQETNLETTTETSIDLDVEDFDLDIIYPTHYFLSTPNIDKLMSHAKYSHHLNK